MRALILGLLLTAGVAESSNLIPNPDFSSPDVSAWSSGALVSHEHVADSGSDLPGGSGPGALQVTYSYHSGAWSGPRYVVDGLAPGMYDLGGSFYIPDEVAQGQSLSLSVRFSDSAGASLLLTNIGRMTETGIWTHREATLEAPPGTTQAWIYASVYSPDDSTASSPPSVGWFDDLYFLGEGGPVQELFVPAAASARGQNGTQWSTGGWFANATNAAVDVSAALLPEGNDNTAALAAPMYLATIPPSGAVRLADLVATLGFSNAGGGLYLIASTNQVVDLPLVAVTTHTFTPNPEGGGTFGQGIPARAAGPGGWRVLPGMIQTSGFRTNFGVLNTSGAAMDLEIAVRDFNGTVMSRQTWTLAPYEWRQRSLPALGVNSLTDGSIELEAESSASYLAYSSTVDQFSGDAVFNPAQ